MAVASNADDYTTGRVNIFFPANNTTPEDGNLTGQCVTLIKWFLAEMCDNFPNPFAARGDARYVGQNLVAQGLAVEVPYDQRRRGDIVCYEYGTYGHIAVQLSGGRVFEENVNWPGTTSKVVDGSTVYSSRIGDETEAWRATKNPHVYRLNSYKEGDNDMATNEQIDQWISLFHQEAYGSAPSDAIFTDWRAVLKNNFVEGSLSIMAGTDNNAGALKNKPQGNFVPVTDQLFKKG